MRQLVYVSTAAGLGPDQVAAILASAERHNPRAEITGFLLYNGQNFLQYIEGPRASLASLLNRLSRDTRHTGMVVLEDSAIEQRSCPGWAMQRLRLLDAPTERRAAIDEGLPPALSEPVRKLVSNFAALN